MRRLDGLYVFLADLLLDQGAANQLLQRPLRRELPLAYPVGIENREADLVFEIAGQDGVLVDHRYHTVKNDGG